MALIERLRSTRKEALGLASALRSIPATPTPPAASPGPADASGAELAGVRKELRDLRTVVERGVSLDEILRQ